jgi:hypothetical protein
MARISRKKIIEEKSILTESELIHFNVNNSINFLNSADRRVHTQGIEGVWPTLKCSVRAKLEINQN